MAAYESVNGGQTPHAGSRRPGCRPSQRSPNFRLVSTGAAERLPCPDSSFDLVVSTTSFDHWSDHQAGLRACARVLMPGGHLMLADPVSPWLIPTLIGGRRDKARTRRRAVQLLSAGGFTSIA